MPTYDEQRDELAQIIAGELWVVGGTKDPAPISRVHRDRADAILAAGYVSSEVRYAQIDAIQYERDALREEKAALEAVIAEARALLPARERTWAESLPRDHGGNLFPRLVDADAILAILSVAPSDALADYVAERVDAALQGLVTETDEKHDREVKRKFLLALADLWSEPEESVPLTAEEIAEWFRESAKNYSD